MYVLSYKIFLMLGAPIRVQSDTENNYKQPGQIAIYTHTFSVSSRKTRSVGF